MENPHAGLHTSKLLLFPVHLHFKCSFLQLPSASCDQSGNTQETNCARLLSNTHVPHNTTGGVSAHSGWFPGKAAHSHVADGAGAAPASPVTWAGREQLLVGSLRQTQNLGAVFRAQEPDPNRSGTPAPRCAGQNHQLPSVTCFLRAQFCQDTAELRCTAQGSSPEITKITLRGHTNHTLHAQVALKENSAGVFWTDRPGQRTKEFSNEGSGSESGPFSAD